MTLLPRPQSLSAGRVLPDHLLETHLARVLFSAQRHRWTGVLTVDEGSVRTRLHVVEGQIVFAQQGRLAETLGRLLLSEGELERDEYLLILDEMAKPSERDEVSRFGDVAIRLGMIGPLQLGEALARQVRIKLEHVLQADEAIWMWEEGDLPPPGSSFPTPLEPTLREALRNDPQPHRWPGLLVARRNHVVHLREAPDEIARRFELTPPELRLLRTMDRRPLASVLSGQVLEAPQTAALLAALLFADELELGEHVSDRAPPPPPDEREPGPPNPERLRRLTRQITAQASSAASLAAAGGAQTGERAREAAARLREEITRRGAAPSSSRARLEAERAFETGRRLMAWGRRAAAREHFERATALLPEAAEYALHLRWCQYVETSDPAHRAVYEQELRAAVLEALAQDRRMAFAHYVQGRLYLLDEDERAAARAFTIASKLDPEDVEAARYARLLERRRRG